MALAAEYTQQFLDVATARSSTGSIRVLGRVIAPTVIADATGSLAADRPLAPAVPGDLVWLSGSVAMRADEPLLSVERVEIAQRGSCTLPPALASGPERYIGDLARLRLLQERYRFLADLRAWFHAHDFLEVDVPALLPAAGTDVNIDPVEARFRDVGGVRYRGFLHTSPELSLKRLLVAGLPRVVFLGSVFRSGEQSRLHQLEFTMAEWYRAGGDYTAMMSDLEAMLASLLGGHVRHAGQVIELKTPVPRVTMRELFHAACGVDLGACPDAPTLRTALRARGLPANGTAFDELFCRVFVDLVEPRLARFPAVFVVDYPAPLAALARLRPGAPLFAERFELYACGIELANGYTELTDAHEQRTRFEQDQGERARQGLPELPIPEVFLQSLAMGMPPSGGVSLGVDRLFMLKSGANDIADVIAFPLDRQRFTRIANQSRVTETD